jgi:hypothetical protein
MSGFQTCPLDQVVDTLRPLPDRSLSTKAVKSVIFHPPLQRSDGLPLVLRGQQRRA